MVFFAIHLNLQTEFINQTLKEIFMKNFIWSLCAIALVGTLTLSSCGDGGTAAAAAEMEKMTADSIAQVAADAKVKFETETNAAIERMGTQMDKVKESMNADGVTEEVKAEMQEKLDQMESMVSKLKANLSDAASSVKDAAAGAASDVKDAASSAAEKMEK
jgi:hypothetical protein